ncbi:MULTISPECIES: acyl-CoA dehydrogenase family protein [unclassified Acinetobacter]|uniref:acyl-CoA dehydrogenase family protein n=1 Tax=unclassified Acinetobacter TaxID=196816 RepID=UPI0018EAE594|nr:MULTISPECIES: acyl-CoA dehydrogenase family protein [unclassified Acinetobacter]MBJ6352983.1 acyl-CoA dehydrogenase family protein [Acinetobacter sp. c1]MBM0958602.1 acyl-CoA dehydrogenase family protein [Acinetobacter sp. C13]
MINLKWLTHELETALGGAYNSKNIYSNQALLELDQRSEFPNAIVNKLNEWGLPNYYIPKEHGGRLEGYDELFHLLRLISRRDLTTAIGHGKTMLGSISIWIAGSEFQCKELASSLQSYEAISLALTEQENGSDISSTNTVAHKSNNKFILNGEKYLINNARRSKTLSVFARTNNENNSRDFSIFWVDKSTLNEGQFSYLPKIKTHGIRGADISGIRFNNAILSKDQLVGLEGHGLEIILCGFQITRTLCCALSSGAGDHALRMAWQFANQRHIYHSTLAQLPLVKRRLEHAAIDLIISECVSLFSSRAINLLPQQMSIISAAAKAFVPPAIESMTNYLVDVLGARSYLERLDDYGDFSKLQRDCRLISLFDGNTTINLQMLIVQLPAIAKKRFKCAEDVLLNKEMEYLFSLKEDLPTLDSKLLKLSSKGNDFIVSGLLNAKSNINILKEIDDKIRFRINNKIEQLIIKLEEVDDYFLNHALSKDIPVSSFKKAEEYTKIFAASCCIHAFIYSSHYMHKVVRNGNILLNCLERLLGKTLSSTQDLESLVNSAVDNNLLISKFEYSQINN